MKDFSNLISAIEMTNKVSVKMAALVKFFEDAAEDDKLWVVALFTGKKPKRPIKTTLLKQWCLEICQIPEWLFLESYSTVGDLGETISLLLPPPNQLIEKSLSEWMEDLKVIKNKSDEEKKQFVLMAWNGLEQQERFIFNKLIGGSFRIGVSKKGLVNALAKYTEKDANQIMHSISGKWELSDITFNELILGDHINYDNSKPYPFCLAYPLDQEVEELGNTGNWQVEYKWDGIRGQIIKRNHEIYIWSRGEEIVSDQFPELMDTFAKINRDFVIDGEIIPLKDGNVLKFNDLQKRLNRKTIGKKLLEEVPVGFYAYDCLEIDQQDIRLKSLKERRDLLEQLLTEINGRNIFKSTIIDFTQWNELEDIRENSRSINSEGLMLKNKLSPYHVGRKRGDWWKWKVDPLTIDAVMIYAQRGSGRRSGYYTDYTFAVKKGDELVSIAKAYSGLTDKEIQEVSRFVRNNEIEKFGPVRTVKAELVFELAFEGIALSNRHKSGVALRFPRIKRWRKDKTVADIDTIESVKALIN